jgi:hypothetical protein
MSLYNRSTITFCQVKDHMKRSVRILSEGSAKDVEKLLPISLRKIEQIADTCTTKVEAVVEKYNNVMVVSTDSPGQNGTIFRSVYFPLLLCIAAKRLSPVSRLLSVALFMCCTFCFVSSTRMLALSELRA